MRLKTSIKLTMLLVFIMPLFTSKVHAFRTDFFSAGLSFYSFDYSETYNHGGTKTDDYSQELGLIIGLNLRAQYEFKFHFFLAGNFELAYFPTTYSGKTTSLERYESATNNFFSLSEIKAGYAFYPGNTIRIALFTGAGYRYWLRWLNPDINGYREDYSWLHVIAGIKADFKITNNLIIGIEFQLKIMVYSRIFIYLTQSNDPQFDIDEEFNLGNKTNFRVEIPIEYYLSKNFGLTIIFWYNYSAIGKSDFSDHYYPGIDIHEPESRTHQAGIHANFIIYFK